MDSASTVTGADTCRHCSGAEHFEKNGATHRCPHCNPPPEACDECEGEYDDEHEETAVEWRDEPGRRLCGACYAHVLRVVDLTEDRMKGD